MRTPFYATLRLMTLMLAAVLAACAGESQAPEANPIPEGMKEGPGIFSGKSGNLLDAFNDRKDEDASFGLGVNGYLWRAALDTISFMPITQTDSAGGVIITDWYTDPANAGERYKMNIYILSRTLRADGIRVQAFRQVQSNGKWDDASVAADVTRKLEDTILTKARRLRVEDNATK